MGLCACTGEAPEPAVAPEPVVTEAPLAPPPALDAYGDPLPAGAVQRLGTGRLRHHGDVADLTWIGDDRIASAGDDGELRVWDGRSGRRLAPLAGLAGTALAATSDGALLAVANPGLVVSDATGSVAWRNEGAPRAPDLAFSPDGSALAVASDSTVEVLRADTGELVRSLGDHREPVERVAWSPDGAALASVDASGLVLLHDARNGELRTTFTLVPGALPARVLAFSSDGRWIAVGRDPIEVRDAATGAFYEELSGPGPAEHGAFTTDGLVLVYSGPPAAVVAWDPQTGAERLVWRDIEARPLVVVAASPDGDRFALADGTGRFTLRDAATGARIDEHAGHDAAVTAVAFAGPGTAWTGGDGGRVFRWDTATATTRELPEIHTGGATSLALSPDGARLLTGGWDGLAREWDVATFTVLRTLSAGAPAHVGWRSDGVPVTFSTERGLLAWEGDSPTLLAAPRTGPAGIDLDGRRAVVPTTGGMAVVDLADGTVLRSLTTLATPAASLQAARFSPDGGRIAFASADSRAWIVDAEDRDVPRILVGPAGLVGDIAWSPDGTRVLTTHPDGAWVWDADTGAPLRRLVGQDDFTTAADWAGDRLATASADGTVLIWEGD